MWQMYNSNDYKIIMNIANRKHWFPFENKSRKRIARFPHEELFFQHIFIQLHDAIHSLHFTVRPVLSRLSVPLCVRSLRYFHSFPT